MKKVIVFLLCVLITTLSLSVCGCKKAPVRAGQASSKSFGKSSTFSYEFPYIKSGSSVSSSSRTFLPVSNGESDSQPDYEPYVVVMRLIFNIEEITAENYAENEEILIYANSRYDALSDSDKVKVTNYDLLKTATDKFNELLLRDNQPKIDAFNQAVNALTFEYTAEFKSVLDELSIDLSKIHDNFASQVDSSKNALNAFFQTYSDHEKAKEVVVLIDNLPSEINDINVGKFKLAVGAYEKLTNAQKLLIEKPYTDRISSIKESINEKYSVLTSLTIDCGVKNEVFSVLNSKVVDGNFTYCDKAVTKGAVLNGESKIIVSALYGGEIRLFLANSSDKLTVCINQGSTTLHKVLACENSIVSFLLTDIGTYSITFENSGSTTLYAIDFR